MRLRGGVTLNVDIDAAFPTANHFLAWFKDVMLEAAATSFQLHLQVPPAVISRTYNASVILTAPLVAIAANSPFLFGQALDEKKSSTVRSGTVVRLLDEVTFPI